MSSGTQTFISPVWALVDNARRWQPFTSAPTGKLCVEELSSLLQAVLPALTKTINRHWQALPEPGLGESITSPATTKYYFHLEMYSALFQLEGLIKQWTPSEIVQRSSPAEAKMRNNLEAAAKGLERCFLSRKSAAVTSALKRLEVEQTATPEPFWKLRAFKRSREKREEAGNREMSERELEDISRVIRFYHTSSGDRDRLLREIQAAVDFFYELPSLESSPDCPINLWGSPMKHVAKLSKILFEVVRSSWICECDGNKGKEHADRETCLNLTKHQRFEMKAVEGTNVSEKEHRFRLLFPTNACKTVWQDTDITVSDLE